LEYLKDLNWLFLRTRREDDSVVEENTDPMTKSSLRTSLGWNHVLQKNEGKSHREKSSLASYTYLAIPLKGLFFRVQEIEFGV
jgi:hypothetical protein